MTDLAQRSYSLDDYWAVERASPLRHEYLHGAILAIPGASPRHDEVAANVLGALYVALRSTPCRPVGSDQRIRVSAEEYTYPDVSVFCGPMVLADGVPPETATNPVAVVEVLSDGTREYDRGAKREMYQRLPSVQTVVLVDPERVEVEVWRRDGPAWVSEKLTALEQTLRIADAQVPLSEIYGRAIT